MLKKSLIAISLASVIATPAFADTYMIDDSSKGSHASINFSVKHLGFSWLTGRFDNFSGEFTYDPAKPEESSVNVSIDTNSVNTNHAERDKHIRSGDFLNVAKFPKATFVSKKIVVDSANKNAFDIVGDLTLNGVTKTITIDAEKIGQGDDPWGGYRAGFEGEAEITMKDFNIKMDLGPASQTVKLKLQVEGIKK